MPDSLSETPVTLLSRRAAIAPVLHWTNAPSSSHSTFMQSLRSAVRARKGAVALLMTLALLSVMFTACESSKGSKSEAVSGARPKADAGCMEQPGSTPVALAVRDFIKHSEPKPMRFLTAAGTDSAIPDDGLRELQDKGPTYFYSGPEAALKKVRAKLDTAGPYTALLVVMHGDKKNDDGTEVVQLGGHYLTGEFDGKSAVSRAYTMACDTAGWRIKSKADQ